MPRKAKRPCRQRGCPNLTDSASGYCPQHEKAQAQHYDRYHRSPEHSKRYGYQWRKLRARFLNAHPLCEQCKLEGRYTAATEVHHIRPLSDGGTNDINNLMALCKPCHSRITLTTELLNRGRGYVNLCDFSD
ncbi:MAG: HNH endonuclease [Selenomonadaceae bacterium]|nr:HNH endonuclease [Selenomonadaceae bacterium]